MDKSNHDLDMPPRQHAILIGGLVIGILGVPYLDVVNCFCFFGVVLGGAVAVQQFVSRSEERLALEQGAVLGICAGVLGAAFGTLLALGLHAVGLESPSISGDLMMGRLDDRIDAMEYQSQEVRERHVNRSRPNAITLANVGIFMCVYALFGGIGGVIGAAVFVDRDGV